MRAVLAGLGALAVLAGHSVAAEPTGLERAAVQARAALDNELLDYPSTRFRNVSATPAPKAPTAIYICGELNTKNRFGAYGGWTGFSVTPGDPNDAHAYVADTERGEIMVEAFCGPKSLGTPLLGDQTGLLTYRAK